MMTASLSRPRSNPLARSVTLILPLETETDLYKTIPRRLLPPLVSAYLRGRILNDLSHHVDEILRWWIRDNDVFEVVWPATPYRSDPARELHREYLEDIHKAVELLDLALPHIGDTLFDWYPCEHLNVSFLSYHANDNSIAVRITNG